MSNCLKIISKGFDKKRKEEIEVVNWMREQRKIFCVFCKHYHPFKFGEVLHTPEHCKHPEIPADVCGWTKPKKANANNDCKYFARSISIWEKISNLFKIVRSLF